MTVAYTLGEQARTDLEKIWLCTREQWGIVQADSYLQALFSRFDWLAENPEAGRKRDDIKIGYFCFPEGMRLIFYIINNNQIEIIGVPHQRMDVVDYLG